MRQKSFLRKAISISIIFALVLGSAPESFSFMGFHAGKIISSYNEQKQTSRLWADEDGVPTDKGGADEENETNDGSFEYDNGEDSAAETNGTDDQSFEDDDAAEMDRESSEDGDAITEEDVDTDGVEIEDSADEIEDSADEIEDSADEHEIDMAELLNMDIAVASTSIDNRLGSAFFTLDERRYDNSGNPYWGRIDPASNNIIFNSTRYRLILEWSISPQQIHPDRIQNGSYFTVIFPTHVQASDILNYNITIMTDSGMRVVGQVENDPDITYAKRVVFTDDSIETADLHGTLTFEFDFRITNEDEAMTWTFQAGNRPAARYSGKQGVDSSNSSDGWTAWKFHKVSSTFREQPGSLFHNMWTIFINPRGEKYNNGGTFTDKWKEGHELCDFLEYGTRNAQYPWFLQGKDRNWYINVLPDIGNTRSPDFIVYKVNMEQLRAQFNLREGDLSNAANNALWNAMGTVRYGSNAEITDPNFLLKPGADSIEQTVYMADKSQVEFTFKDDAFANGECYIIMYSTKVTDELSRDKYWNEATFTMNSENGAGKQGYVVTEERYADGVGSGSVISRKGYFTIKKTDENGLPLGGVKFTITKPGGGTATAVTGPNGLATFLLDATFLGTCRLKETVPEGSEFKQPYGEIAFQVKLEGNTYVVDDASYKRLDSTMYADTDTPSFLFDLVTAWSYGADSGLVIKNEKTSEPVRLNIYLTKTDRDDINLRLTGAKFNLAGPFGVDGGADFKVIDLTDASLVTIDLGIIGRGNLTGQGPWQYTLTETAAPKGYRLLTEPIYFSVDKDGVITLNQIDSNRAELSESKKRIIVKNEKRAELGVTLKKVNKYNPTGEMGNAQFRLYRLNDSWERTDSGTIIYTNGTAELNLPVSLGKYELYETGVPEGYNQNEASRAFFEIQYDIGANEYDLALADQAVLGQGRDNKNIVLGGGGSDFLLTAENIPVAQTPVFVTDLTAIVSAINGDDIILSVMAQVSDGGTLTYQWYKDGVPVPGATGTTYTIENAGVGNSGAYHVVARNSRYLVYATAQSQTCTVTVKNLYRLSYDKNGGGGIAPAGGEYAPGTPLLVDSGEGLVPSGQEYRFAGWNDSHDGLGNDYTPGMSKPMPEEHLTLYAVWERIPSHTVSYYVNGGDGTPPATQSVREGETFVIARPDGITAPTDYKFLNWNTRSQGTGTAYQPETSVTMGETNFRLYAIWERKPPTVTQVAVWPASVEIEPGKNYVFSAEVQGERYPDQAVTWSIESSASLKPGTKVEADTGRLTIDGSETDGLTFNIKATSVQDNSKSGTATVTVKKPPEPTVTNVKIFPASALLYRGETLSFSAAVEGLHNPSQEVIWTVENANAGTHISSAGYLTVGSNETSDKLTVRATSAVDNAQSATAVITVVQPASAPEITVDLPGEYIVEAGQSITLTVSANVDGEGTLTYEWYKGNEVLADKTGASLTISNAKASDEAGYYVIVRNTRITGGQEQFAEAKSNTCVLRIGYRLAYDANSGIGSVPAGGVYLPGAQFFAGAADRLIAPENMRFVEWNEINNGGGKGYKPNDDISMPAKHLTLYAIWEEIPLYSVTYYLNGGIGITPQPVEVRENKTFIAAQAEGFKLNDHRFNGWNTKSDGTGIFYAPGMESQPVNAPINLYAIWEILPPAAIEIHPESPKVKKGTQFQFSAYIIRELQTAATADPKGLGKITALSSQEVSAAYVDPNIRWDVTGNVDDQTIIDQNGLLTLGQNELDNGKITVSAVLGENISISDSTTVSIVSYDPDAVVTGVMVRPTMAHMLLGESRMFVATVLGSDGDNAATPNQGVIWGVEGGTSSQTVIDTNGRLTIGADENALQLFVKATSVISGIHTGTATVNIRHTINVPDITVNLPVRKDVNAGEDVTFVVEAETNEKNAVLSYQWYKDGVPIAGEVNPVLRIIQSASTDVGMYQVAITATKTLADNTTKITAQAVSRESQLRIRYKAEYDLNGGTGLLPAAQWYHPGASFIAASPDGLTAPQGKRFQIWNTKIDGSGNSYEPGSTVTMSAQNLTLYAIWGEIPSYAVSYDANGGGGTPPATQSVREGEIFVVARPDGIIPPADYRFLYWNTNRQGTGTAYQPETSVTMGATDFKLYAIWERKPSAVTQVIVWPASAEIEPGKNYMFSAEVQGERYPDQAVTWTIENFASLKPDTKIDVYGRLNIDVTEAAGTTFTIKATSVQDSAKSGEATVTVKKPPEPTVTNIKIFPASALLNRGETLSFSAAVEGLHNPSQEVIWTVENAHTGTYISSAGYLTVGSDEKSDKLVVRATSVADHTKSAAAVVTVVQPVTAPEITADLPGEYIAEAGQSVILSVSAKTENGGQLTYQWYKGNEVLTDKTGPSLTISNARASDEGEYHVIVRNTRITGDQEQFAEAESNTCMLRIGYRLSYDINSGEGSLPFGGLYLPGSQFPAGSANRLIAPEHMRFVEWNEVSDGSGNGYKPNDAVSMPAKHLTLYAIWEEIPIYSITYHLNGGIGTPPPSAEVRENKTFTVAQAEGFKLNDHRFNGWNDESDGTGIFYMPGMESQPIQGHVELYAVWEMLPPAAIEIHPESPKVQKGAQFQFSAHIIRETQTGASADAKVLGRITGVSSPDISAYTDPEINWYVMGNIDIQTKIDQNGLLTVGQNEPENKKITVRAILSGNASISDSTTVTVVSYNPDAAVTGVTVRPTMVHMLLGESRMFTASVIGSDNDNVATPNQGVIWSVEGGTSSDTTIDTNGRLTVGADENVLQLLVKATSVVSSNHIGTGTVYIQHTIKVPDITVNLPVRKDVNAGETATLLAEAQTNENNVVLSYQWYKDNVPIYGKTSNSLQIDKVDGADAGVYKVIITATKTLENNAASITAQAISRECQLRVRYKAEYDLNGGTGQLPGAQWHHPGTSFITANADGLTAPQDKQFKAWNTKTDGSGISYESGSTMQMSAENIVLYAIWEDIPVYSVTYDLNGGSGTVPMRPGAREGEVFAASSPDGLTPPAGYNAFYSWNTRSDGSGTTYGAGAAVTMPGNAITLYAIWKKMPPTVTMVSVNPPAAMLNAGESRRFEATVTGDHSPSGAVTWTVTSRTTGTVIDESGILTVSDSELFGVLTVRATSAADPAKSGAAMVTVKIPPAKSPVITADLPPRKDVMTGDQLTLTVTATVSGGGILTYQWYKDGNALPGAEDPSYTIAHANKSYEGNYHIVITNTKVTADGVKTTATAISNTCLLSVANPEDGGGNGNNSGSGGNSSNSSGGNNGSNAESQEPIGYVNGNEISLELNEDGSVSRILSEEEAEEHHDSTDTYDILIPGQSDIRLTLPVEKLRDSWLVIHTDFGKVTFSNEGLQRFRIGHGTWITIHIVRGSVIISMIDEYGEELDYDDPIKPLLVEMPMTPENDHDWRSYVMTTGDEGSILPFSMWTGGMVKARVSKTGKFDFTSNPKTFIDIEDHWAYESIRFTAAREIFTGTGGGKFDADSTMTRAMIAAVVANMQSAELSERQNARYSDVPVGKWYTSAIEWMADAGIVKGMGDGRFAPQDNVTREQTALILYQYLLYKGGLTEDKGVLPAPAFLDADEVSPWAREAVEYMHQAGIISGRPGNVFDPKASATRGEIAGIIARFVEAYVNQ